MDKEDLELYLDKTVFVTLKGSNIALGGKIIKVSNSSFTLDRGGAGYEQFKDQIATYRNEDVIKIKIYLKIRP